MKVKTLPVCTQRGSLTLRGPIGTLHLRSFQEEVVEFFKQSAIKYLFLKAPTGSGKTITVIAPLLARILGGPRYEGVLAVYPTRALVHDQFSSVRSTLLRLGARETRSLPKDTDDKCLSVLDVELEVGGTRDRSRIALLLLTSRCVSNIKEQLGDELKSEAPRRNVLKKVIEDSWLRDSIDYIVTFAVPEYPYLLASRIYSNPHAAAMLGHVALGKAKRLAERLLRAKDPGEMDQVRAEALSIVGSRFVGRSLLNILAGLGDVVFMDEYHVWSGFEKPTVLALIASYIILEPFTGVEYRIVFSSATPEESTKRLIEDLSGTRMKTIEAKIVDCNMAGVDIIRGPSEIEIIPVDTVTGPIGWPQVDSRLPDVVMMKIDELRTKERFIVLGRRTSSVEQAAKIFHEKTGREPIIVTGIEHPIYPGRSEISKRKEVGDLPLFGNFAVEIGVDIKNVYYGIISAATPGELIQRAGRIGRGPQVSKVLIPVPKPYYHDVVRRMAGNTSPGYEEALQAIAGTMRVRHPAAMILDRMALNHPLGKTRLYIPLGALALSILASDKVRDRAARLAIERYLRILKTAFYGEQDELWILTRMSRTPHTLSSLASFRITWSLPYTRMTGGVEVKGEAAWSSILSNFEVIRLEGSIVVINGPNRKKVRDILELKVTKKAEEAGDITDSVLPGFLAAELLSIKSENQDSRDKKILASLIASTKHPFYIATPSKDYEVLQAYGYTVKIVHKDDGGTVAYLIPL